MKLLLIEDDAKLVEHLIENLRDNSFMVSTATTADEINLYLESSNSFDVIVLDRLIGSTDSKVFLPAIRKKWPTTPLLILSAISTPNERTELLNMGADDYVGKPFSMQELVARIKVLLRRSTPVQASNFIQIGNLIIDTMARTISVGQRTENLPAKEFLLLRAMSQDTKKIWSRNDLLDYVWGQSTSIETNVVESTITNLRKRLTDISANVIIRNMRNAGYWIEE